MYLGSWKIDDVLYFYANTTRFDTGNATDADSDAGYRVYENETGTPLLTGAMSLLDSANTAGFYSEAITLSAANGFEKGKQYSIYKFATVNSIAGASHDTFQIEAEVDANTVSAGVNVTQIGGDTQSATDLKDFVDAGYDPSTNKVQGVVLTDTVTTYTGNTPQTGDAYALLVTVATYIDTEVAAIKAKTDQLTFTIANKVDSSLQAAGDFAATIANKIADHTLRRTYANARASSDGDAVSFRSLLGAIAKLVNKWSISGTTLTITHEDDTTSAGTQTLTGTAGADPITTIDTD